MVFAYLVVRFVPHFNLESLMADDSVVCRTVVTHWLPIVTRCPLSVFPDLIFIRVHFSGFQELYTVRKFLRKRFSFRKMFMEDIASEVLNCFTGSCRKVEVRLMFKKHVVTIERGV